jgi:U3 small nucleolar RNA-associated protein 4
LADVLALTASADGKTVYSSGVDRKICQFKLLQISKNKNDSNARASSSNAASSMEWMICGEKRYHTHDVHALCLLDVIFCSL